MKKKFYEVVLMATSILVRAKTSLTKRSIANACMSFTGLMAVVVMTACTPATSNLKTAAVVTLSAAELKYQYDNGDVVEFVTEVQMTAEEQATIARAVEQANASVDVLTKHLTDPESVVDALFNVDDEYTKLKFAYIEVKTIVHAHQLEYTPEAWLSFIRFDAAIQTLNNNYLQLAAKAQDYEVLITTLRTAIMLRQMAEN